MFLDIFFGFLLLCIKHFNQHELLLVQTLKQIKDKVFSSLFGRRGMMCFC